MDNYAWQAGKNLKRAVEATGRVTTTRQWAVAIWIKAQEEDLSLDDIVHELILASEFEKTPTDPNETIRQLGY